VKIFQIPDSTVPIAQKNFFRADKVEMHWNRNGSNLLAVTQTEVDQSGKSYYGESNLYLLSTRGGFDAKVTLDKEGPVHDVVWNPQGKEFVVVYGYMPSKAVLYDSKCNVVHDFGSNHRNTAKFNPQGRLLCLAGFGNLAGDIDFWDCKELKRISSVQDNSTTYYDWSPDGRHLLTATLSPRLRVDNCFKIWHYHGLVKHKTEFKELYQVGWRPIRDETLYPMRELTPPPKGLLKQNGSGSKEAAKPKAYIPPHQRAKMMSAAGTGAGAAGTAGAKKGAITIKASPIPSGNGSNNSSPNTLSSSDAVKQPLSEAMKRKKALMKKLKQVEQLKEKKLAGEKLELNQVSYGWGALVWLISGNY
jgi:translation initiation factor 2A